jgi:hypothetical protein
MIWGDYVKVLNPIDEFTPRYLDKEIQGLDVSLDIVSNALVTPSFLDEKLRIMPINVFTQNQIPVLNSQHLRGNGVNVFNTEPFNPNFDKKMDLIEGDTIYLGWFFLHYGHFLMESISRLWVLSFLPRNNYKFLFNTYKKGVNYFHEKVWVLELLSYFGISSENVIFTEKNMCFERLFIPSQSLILHKSVNLPAQKIIWDTIKSSVKIKCKEKNKIYLSRSKLLKDNRLLCNEIDVEKIFFNHGFIIVHPENLCLADQIQLLSNASVVAGPSGSALHNAAFMDENSLLISLTTPDFCLLNEVLCCLPSNVEYELFLGTSNDDGKWSVNCTELDAMLKSHHFINNV